MAASTAGALKAYIETLGLGIAVFRDRVGQDATLPYSRIQEAITMTPRQSGDFGDTNRDALVTEEAQVDLWQQHRNPTTNAVTEDYTLQDTLAHKLHGARLTAAPKRVYGVRVLGVNRGVDSDANTVHHQITVALDRAL